MRSFTDFTLDVTCQRNYWGFIEANTSAHGDRIMQRGEVAPQVLSKFALNRWVQASIQPQHMLSI